MGAPDDAPATVGRTAPASVVPSLERAVPVEHETRLQLRAMPNANCVLSPANDESTALKLFADANGLLEVHVRLDANAGQTTEMNLRCAAGDGGAATTQTLRLHPAAADAPMPSDDPASMLANADPTAIRPALTGDPMAYTQRDLVSRGYPPRPDAASAPGAFQRWMRSVSRPFVRVQGRIIERPDVTNSVNRQASTKTSFNWSGVEIRNTRYEALEGAWNVPSVTGDTSSLNTNTFSVEWIGLDGDGTSDLIQDGTGHDAIRVNGAMITSYYGWFEYVPLGLQQISSGTFSVSHGDSMFAEVWAGESSGIVDPNGGFAWYYLENDTTGQYFETALARPAGAPAFTGTTAEWVMERTKINGQFPELARYTLTTMQDGWAQTTGGTWVGLDSQFPITMSMVGCDRSVITNCTGFSSNLLSGVSRSGNQTMQFTWYHFQ